jgi:hypothetical protein
MSIEENKAIVGRFWEEWSKGNLGIVDELQANNCVFHGPGVREIHGPEGLKQLLVTVLTALPDYHLTVEDMVAEADKVAARLTETGTHQGDFQGIPPTGKWCTHPSICISRIVGGKIVETWCESDMLGLMQHLGAIPPLEQAGG